jgi:hypothetical protein
VDRPLTDWHAIADAAAAHPLPIRAWCAALAATLPVQHITPHGVPYLERYFIAGYSPYRRQVPAPAASLYLHHFLASDPQDEVHSHPWAWALSLLLVGGYREHRCDDTGGVTAREYRPGDCNLLQPTTRHRVELLEADCWSLLLVGPYAQPWTFFADCARG